MNLTNKNDKKTRTSGVASLFGRGSASKIGKSQFSRSMGGIMERLKGLSRKDLAMVGVGLSVLVAAPVAEYMMSAPADSTNMLTSGFSSRESASGMASLYEPGINALSQGSADGAGEVITPLSARDPSSLILGAQPEQPPIDYSSMTGSMGSDSPDSSSSSNAPDMDDMRDSMRDAARNGASEAVKSAGAPTVIPPMGAGLRSLGMFADGGSSSVSGNGKSPITTPSKGKNLSPKQSQMVNPVASAGYKGVANTPKSGSKSGIEQLRAQGDAQGGYFSGAKAMEALDNANSVKISGKPGDGPGEGFGGGGFGHGDGYKGPQKGDHHNSHKHSGRCETLACKAAEARMKKALEWEFFWGDLGRDILKNTLNTFATKGTEYLLGLLTGEKSMKYCVAYVKKIDNDPNPCVKGNAKILFSSRDKEEQKSWKDNCTCGIMSKKNADKLLGGEANTPSDSGNDPQKPKEPSQNEILYLGYVETFDAGLMKLWKEMLTVRENAFSNPPNYTQSATYARTAVDTFVSIQKGAGIGLPFKDIYNLVSGQAAADEHLRQKYLSNWSTIKGKLEEEKEAGKKYIQALKDVSDNPDLYATTYYDPLVKSYVKVAITEEDKKLLKEALDKYEPLYSLHVNKAINTSNQSMDDVFKILDNNITKSSEAVANVYNEYNSVYIAKVNSFKNIPDSAELPQLNDFLVKMGYETNFSDSEKKKLNKFLPKDQRLRHSPAEVEVPPMKALEIWRGLDMFNYDSEKSSDETFDSIRQKIKESEISSWKIDNPINEKGLIKQERDLVTLRNGPIKLEVKQFYAPGYRIVIEIPEALDSLKDTLEDLATNLELTVSARNTQYICSKFNKVSFCKDGNNGGQGGGNNGGNGGDQGGGNNGGNGGDQGGGNNGGNGGDQGGGNNGGNGGSQGGTTRSVCANGEDNCTYQDIIDAQKWANARNKYSKKNKVASPVWEEYKNLAPGMDKNDTEWLNHTGKVHTLRREYDELQSEEDSLKPNTPENKARLAEIDKRKREIEAEVTKEREAADARWAKLCKKAGYSTNACKQAKPQNYSSVDHNHTNTTGTKPNSGTTQKPSSSKKPEAPDELTTFGYTSNCMIYTGVGNGKERPFSSMEVTNKKTHMYKSSTESCGKNTVSVLATCRFDETNNRWVIKNAWRTMMGPTTTSSSKFGAKGSIEGGGPLVKAKAEVSGETGSSETANNEDTIQLTKAINKDCK